MVHEAAKLTGRPTRHTVSVVIPTMNEARNIPTVLGALPDYIDEIVLVDANSVDGTVEAALTVRPDIRVIRQTRRGKGNALAAGFEAATGDYVVMIDADGSMDPAEIDAFVLELDNGADYVKGSRFVPGGGSDDISPLRRAGNWGLNTLTNVLFLTRYTDLCYGYNAFRKDAIPSFGLPAAHTPESSWGDGFEVETLINIRVARADLAIAEVPSFEYDRLHGESNLRTFRDGWRVLVTIMRERFSRKLPVRTPVKAQPPLHAVDAPVVTTLPARVNGAA
ncbi:glycosyltransferase family 2 protein [Cryptosporangium aurantiacum]|uniref:Glycosyl transferase family 2 n=1 Tax=Cryptosporangium aurantiacum TaxID=134849 RepID=A0A1M7RML7_9ACTN|nr:glycosyltransferase family 2 protein [Cryptosporangium aurantiacum]SHN47575.1 Glycosyl transferase family 2 [Cryptosporangium aurantiacum]